MARLFAGRKARELLLGWRRKRKNDIIISQLRCSDKFVRERKENVNIGLNKWNRLNNLVLI